MKLSLLSFLAAMPGAIVANTLDPVAKCLSSGATISYNQSTSPRWSDYQEPIAAAVVTPATETDVQRIVTYCVDNNIPFLVQSGGHGWSADIKLPNNGNSVIINMRGLNSISFNADKTLATVGGGTISSEAIAAAWANNTQVHTGNCDTVGVLGAALGGGYGNLLGVHGFAVDQMTSMNVVLADGGLTTVTPEDTDLWWALRGAGPNFGIVTSLTMKAYPTPQNESVAWTPGLFFDESKLPQLVTAINNLQLDSNMNIYMYYITSNGTPAIMCTIFYLGTEEEGMKQYASIFNLGPSQVVGGITPYNQWNAAAAGLNAKGDRKPGYGASTVQLESDAWVQIWNSYKELVSDPDYVNSLVICEAYSLIAAQKLETGGTATASSFPGRNWRFNAAAIGWYKNDTTLDAKAQQWGSSARDLMRNSSGLSNTQQYVNFAFGDESAADIYGPALDRLKMLKKQYDPKNVFGYWFDVKA